MIDPTIAWLLNKQNALKALKTNMFWHSLVQEKKYTILEVLEDRLIIQREGDGSPEELTTQTLRH